MNVEIAERLRCLRRERGLSQEALGNALGVPWQSISKWERAEAAPDAEALLRLARLYGCPVDALLGSAEEEAAEFEILPERDEGVSSGWFATSEAAARGTRPPRARQGGTLTQAIPYPMLMCMLYCALGMLFGLWHPAWLLLLTIPLYEPIRRIQSATDLAAALHAFPYPLFVTFVYLCGGIFLGWWHPLWLLYLTIPLYHRAIHQLA